MKLSFYELRISIGVLVVALFAAIPGVSSASDWPHFKGSEARASVASGNALVAPLERRQYVERNLDNLVEYVLI